MSRQTTLGRFGFEKSISQRNSVMETKAIDFFSTMSRAIECNHTKLYLSFSKSQPRLYCVRRTQFIMRS